MVDRHSMSVGCSAVGPRCSVVEACDPYNRDNRSTALPGYRKSTIAGRDGVSAVLQHANLRAGPSGNDTIRRFCSENTTPGSTGRCRGADGRRETDRWISND